MKLAISLAPSAGYKNPTQIARRVTEAWGESHLYCPACDSPSVQQEKANTSAVDFCCPACGAGYQLKASKSWHQRVPDAGYNAMIRAVRSDSAPNLLVMQYSRDWNVDQLLLIPSFFFTDDSIEARKPLAPTARRAGWVGCNINLGKIAEQGKLWMVKDRTALDPAAVRAHYRKIRPISSISVKHRGWTLKVLEAVQSINKSSFSLKDVYAHESDIGKAYPKNSNVRAKIRQQLQVLRDLGLVSFLGQGEYRLLQ